MTQRHTPKQQINGASASLPSHAYSPLNRCNLPALILGSLTYQQQPVTLELDGIQVLHGDFFKALNEIEEASERTQHFHHYMRSAFLLGHSEEAGLSPTNRGIRRDKQDYQRLLRGWLFNPDGIEAAVMKRWVESRFGLLTLNHNGPIYPASTPAYDAYQADYVRGLYNSNALEAQLDLLYSYCQYELQRQWPERSHWQLFRGMNQVDKHLRQSSQGAAQHTLLLNNLNSFSADSHQCEAFGDVILNIQVPGAKLLFFPGLLQGALQGEDEYLVIGGLYQASIVH